MPDDRAGGIIAAVILAAVVLLGAIGAARGHDIYSGPEWRVPNNPAVSCCDNRDCRPTRAYMGEDGLWRAWTGAKWLTVPADRVLPTDLAKDGRSHLCASTDDWVFCFSPGEVKG